MRLTETIVLQNCRSPKERSEKGFQHGFPHEPPRCWRAFVTCRRAGEAWYAIQRKSRAKLMCCTEPVRPGAAGTNCCQSAPTTRDVHRAQPQRSRLTISVNMPCIVKRHSATETHFVPADSASDPPSSVSERGQQPRPFRAVRPPV